MKEFFIGLLILNVLGKIQNAITITHVSPLTVTTGVETLVVFTIKIEGDTLFDSTKFKLKGDRAPIIRFENIQGSKLSYRVTLNTIGDYSITYDNTDQTGIKLTSIKKDIIAITPSITLKTADDTKQSIKLKFNRLPLPSEIRYTITDVTTRAPAGDVASCTDNFQRLEKNCMISFTKLAGVNIDSKCFFQWDEETTNSLKFVSILKSDFTLSTITPSSINQNLTDQTISLKFAQDPSEITETIYTDTQKCNCEKGTVDKTLDCTISVKSAGVIPIYIGGVKTGQILNVIKVDGEDLFDVFSKFNKMSAISLMGIIITLFFF